MLASLQILGGLGVFLYGLKRMSEALQTVAGGRLRAVLGTMTKNRFAGILSGFLVTCAVQSSSATTVMVVSFANAGLLTLTQAIGPIMGANIGTTITGWLVSLFGFKVKITAFALPVIGIGFPMSMLGKGKTKQWAEVLIGFGLLFLGLKFLKDGVPDLKSSPEALAFLQQFTEYGFMSLLMFVGIGTLLTVIVQSSSATMAITLTMAAKGWIGYDLAAAMVLGENIGTTITATLAAMPANRTAKRVARLHTIFNLVGVAWMLVLMPFALSLVDSVVPGNPVTDPIARTTHLAAFHSGFNITNTFLLMWFVPQLQRIVERLVPYSQIELQEAAHIQFIDNSVLATPELAALETRRGLQRMLDVMIDIYGKTKAAIGAENDSVDHVLEQVQKLEDQTDRMEEELVAFSTELARVGTSSAVGEAVARTVDMANCIERMADCCEDIVEHTQIARTQGLTFSRQARSEVLEMLEVVGRFLDAARRSLDPTHDSLLEEAEEIWAQLDKLITEANQHKTDLIVGGHLGVRAGLIHIDTMADLRRIAEDCHHIVKSAHEEAVDFGLKPVPSNDSQLPAAS